ncbi:MAG: PilX N-terminal domain-containing pilus assembly protein [Pseudomonadota bacterium]
MRLNKFQSRTSHQKGAVLAVALVFLLVLSLIGISAMNTTMLETRMARNDQEKNYALQAAERGLRDALSRINTNNAQNLVQNGSLTSNDVVDDITSLVRDSSNSDLDAQIRNWQINFVGRFAVPRLPASLASSSIEFESVLFDTQVTAASNSTDTPSLARLQNGMRQLVPKSN